MTISTRFTELFGCEHPIQLAGMGGRDCTDLALAVTRGGGLGMLSGTLARDDLEHELAAIAQAGPVGVNFLAPFLDRAAVELAAQRCRFVELFWAEPDPSVVELIHAGGALAGWQVGSPEEARAALDAGCEVIVAQGVEAGGHVRGTVGLLALLDAVRELTDAVVVGAGGVGNGRVMAAALTAGADAVRMGTRFLVAEESPAHPEYVDALIGAGVEDTVLTTAFGNGWPEAPHRVLRSAVEAGEARGAEQEWRPSWPDAEAAGPVAAQALYAGQSVGAVRRRQPAAEIIAEVMAEAERALQARATR